jgi:predicted aspartyl protease
VVGVYVRARVEMRNGGRVLSAVVLVDTGATGVVVDEGMAEQLGLELFGEGKIVTLGSVVKCCFADVGSMAVEDVDIGSRRVAVCRFPEEVKGRLRPLGFSEGVILGVSAVEDAGYVPDTREGVLRRAGFLAL